MPPPASKLRSTLRSRCRSALAQLDLTPADVAGLALLATGGIAALLSIWLLARPQVAPPPPAVQFPEPSPLAASEGTPAEIVTVHVTGRVRAAGVYRLPANSRVMDAITQAGGALEDATLDAVNLARPLVDGEQVVVPGPGVAPAPPGGGGTAQRPDGTLDLNLATAEELDDLPGIGPVLAERIVSYRTEHGEFTSVDGLRDVRGIGERTFQDLAALLST